VIGIILALVGGFIVIKYVLPQLQQSGGISGLLGGSGSGGGTSPGTAMADTGGGGGSTAKISAGGGSSSTVCTNGNCQTFHGDNISVSCVDGKCTSHNARVIYWEY
jgi:hypothetical protein